MRLSHGERIYGQKHLIQSQIELLDIGRGLGVYKKLRQEELTLKIALKSKVGEAKILIETIESALPKSNYKLDASLDKEESRGKKIRENYSSLYEEMTALSRKLASLQKEM